MYTQNYLTHFITPVSNEVNYKQMDKTATESRTNSLAISINYHMHYIAKSRLNDELTEQWGHTNPLMFSTTPITDSPVFLQNVTSRQTSPTDTAWQYSNQ